MSILRRSLWLVLLVVFSFPVNMVRAMTAEEIINYRDDNEHFQSARVEGEMLVVSGGREMTKSMISLVDGDDALAEFTNPHDRGTKFLKRGEDLYLFFPDAEDIIKISGHMMNQGMMGSDYSYRDVMESERLTDLYEFTILGEEEVDSRPCYKLEGIAREGEEVSYYRRITWVDKERFIGLREELYAQSGRLLKEYYVTDVEEIQGRWYPMQAVMENKLRRDTRTVFTMLDIEFDPEIPAGIFALERLR